MSLGFKGAPQLVPPWCHPRRRSQLYLPENRKKTHTSINGKHSYFNYQIDFYNINIGIIKINKNIDHYFCHYKCNYLCLFSNQTKYNNILCYHINMIILSDKYYHNIYYITTIFVNKNLNKKCHIFLWKRLTLTR